MGKYDKTIKENLAPLIRSLASRVGLNIESEHLEMVKDKLQFTIEREPDFLFKVCHDDIAEDYITQFDFQAQNDMSMPDRMLLYRNIIKWVHKLPVRQVVFYLGNEPLTMPDFLQEPDLYFKYPLIDIRIFTANSFLESDIPQEVILAILGNFEGESPEVMMERILSRLQELTSRKQDFQKFTFHLHVLSGLRKLQRIFKQKIKAMPLIYDIDIENDPIYHDGIEKGEERKATLMVTNLLLAGILSPKRIAEFVDETEAFVINIQKRLIQEGKLLPNAKIVRKKNGS